MDVREVRNPDDIHPPLYKTSSGKPNQRAQAKISPIWMRLEHRRDKTEMMRQNTEVVHRVLTFRMMDEFPDY